MLDRDQFIENAEVYGNRYGVPVSQIDIAKHSNRHAILKIDVQGNEINVLKGFTNCLNLIDMNISYHRKLMATHIGEVLYHFF